MPHQKFDFVELVERHIGNRNIVVRKSQISTAKTDYMSYISIFSFSEEIVTYIQNNLIEGKPSIAYYNGIIRGDFLYFDIDFEGDLNSSIEKCKSIVEILRDKYEVNPESLRVYFSGMKGFHIGVPAYVFGAFGYLSDKLHLIYKHMAMTISETRVNERGQPEKNGIDFSIYNKTSILRKPLSKHNKSELYKVPVSVYDVLNLSLDSIKNVASLCIVSIPYQYSKEVSIPLQDLFTLSVDIVNNIQTNHPQVTGQLESNGMDKIEVEFVNAVKNNTSIFRVPEKGNRNELLFKMAFRLHSIPVLKTNEAMDLLRIVNEVINIRDQINGTRSIDEREFYTITNSAFRRAKLPMQNRLSMKSMDDTVKAMFQLVKGLKFVPTGIYGIDKDLSPYEEKPAGLIRGNSYSFIGKGGTKKSLLAQEMCIVSADTHDLDSIYFNLEMSELEFFKRSFLRVLGINFLSYVEQGLIHETNLEDYIQQMNARLKNRVAWITETGLNSSDMASAVDKRQQDTGRKVSLIVADSMNAMSAESGELTAAVKHSKEFKDICKATDVAGVLINHVTQGCRKHLRDASLFVRGGGKVIDNCDAYISFSSIVDKVKTIDVRNEDTFVYEPSLIYTRYHNKRGTGATIDTILELTDTLQILETGMDISQFK